MVVRALRSRRLFASGSGRRRRGVIGVVVTVTAVIGALVMSSVTASAAGTNGDPVTFAHTQCTATVAGSNLAQYIDITSQVVVPNTATLNEAYTATIPGGTVTLPDEGAGFPISAYTDIKQTYVFRSSSGTAAVTGAVANGGATNNGDPVAFDVSSTSQTPARQISAASWSNGTITYTTTVAHGLTQGQVVDVAGNGNTGYNVAGFLVTTVGSPTTFTVSGRSLRIADATWTADDGGTITYTTTVPHQLNVGDRVTTTSSTPSRYNRTGAIAAVPSPSQFTLTGAGTTAPGLIATKGFVLTLSNPGSIGTPKGTATGLSTVALSTPSASPGDLTTPDVDISFTAPNADATVTSYVAFVNTTATIGLGPAVTTCIVPHNDPQADGISATVVGAGGPTTSSNPTCRPPDVCATTSTTAAAAPTVTNVNPNSGSTAGGNSVTITGTNLTGATDVSFGATAATNFTVDDATHITATAPAHAAGTVDVTVTTGGGTSVTSAADEYTYVAAPAVTSVDPTSGPVSGGTSVTITGANFTGATAVNFGATGATNFTVDDDTQITATAPAHAAGTVDVTVTAPAGTSATGVTDEFTFVAAPVVTDVDPSSGPTSGSTSVTITGSNLTGATAVNFGSSPATIFTVDNDGQITASSPVHAAGTVDVTVTTVGGTSATGAADQFTFVAAPTVTGVDPSSGATAGGTSVTITGTGFTGATAVDFGATPAATFTVDNDTQITASSPAHAAGTVDVTVTTVGGTSATGAADQFTFVAPSGCGAACISIGDRSILEGDSGTRSMTFPVTLSQPANSQVTVHYTVTDGTATGGTKVGSGADYKLKSGTITFTPSVRTGLTPISKQVAVTVWGGTGSEPDETLVVTLDSPTGGPTPGRMVATGTILDDDATIGTKLGIGDGSIVSARAGNQSLKLPVSLSLVPGTDVTVDYTVVPGTATYSKKAADGGDFGGKVSGTLTFLAGKGPLKNIAIPVWPDAIAEADQSFTITLSNVTGAGVTLVRATGTGTIIGIP